jgi:hypothetical protein
MINLKCFHNDPGPNDHTIAQIKDAVRDGLRAVKNTIEDESVVLVRFYLVNQLLIFFFFWTCLCVLIIHSILYVDLLNQLQFRQYFKMQTPWFSLNTKYLIWFLGRMA